MPQNKEIYVWECGECGSCFTSQSLLTPVFIQSPSDSYYSSPNKIEVRKRWWCQDCVRKIRDA